ncbi:unnamed protein product [Leptidea sinapis]|uniref:Cytochrome P450 n=1 Tax=Leptidea sinapis TaxID=189913 RepID=A0A5E4QSZ7_9NEOP|nr:unnamed protein product [Leptidea sinapis]
MMRNNEKSSCKLDMIVKLWALESICVIAVGRRLHCFDPNLPENSPAKKFVKIIQEFFDTIDQLEFKPSLWRYISTSAFRKAMAMYEEEEKLIQYFIKSAHRNSSVKESEISVLEKILAIDENLAVILAGDLIFGGVDTAIQNNLRDHLIRGDEQELYLKSVIKESMRMLPVAMGNIRVTTKPYQLFGYYVPENMQVSFGHQLLSMMDTHYPRPTEFIPDRWFVEKHHPLYHGNAHPFAFNPFGFGARSCIGRRIAEMELEIFLKIFITSFKVGWNGPPPRHRFSTLNFMETPFNFVIEDVM